MFNKETILTIPVQQRAKAQHVVQASSSTSLSAPHVHVDGPQQGPADPWQTTDPWKE